MQKVNAVAPPVEGPLAEEGPSVLAPAANSHFPPFLSDAALATNVVESLEVAVRCDT
jgi:hypothetical protein